MPNLAREWFSILYYHVRRWKLRFIQITFHCLYIALIILSLRKKKIISLIRFCIYLFLSQTFSNLHLNVHLRPASNFLRSITPFKYCFFLFNCAFEQQNRIWKYIIWHYSIFGLRYTLSSFRRVYIVSLRNCFTLAILEFPIAWYLQIENILRLYKC